jgi:N6-adenosine-specific RNA methylase IME4
MPKQTGGDAMRARSQDVTEVQSQDVTAPPPTLAELGVEKMQSHRWQTMADLPEEEFEEHVKDLRGDGKELTSSGVYSLAKREHVKRTRVEPPPMEGKYRVIYADPPWSYGNSMPEYFTEQADHYPLMSIDDICELPVKDLAENNAVLFLWATSPILEEAFSVISSWGFKYKSSFVWDKIKHNMGHYNSVRHEFLLICVRGSCQPDVQKLFDSVQSIERTEHSRKPKEFRNIIDTIYPNGKRIELFARETAENWEAWGNERLS